MSHLTTLIGRIRRKEESGEKYKQDVTKDSSFQNTLINLAEYLLYYRDYSVEELAEAKSILKKYGLGHLVHANQEDIDRELHKSFAGKLRLKK